MRYFTFYVNLHLQNDFCFEKRDWMTVQKHELPDRNKLVRTVGMVFSKSSYFDSLTFLLSVSLFYNFSS